LHPRFVILAECRELPGAFQRSRLAHVKEVCRRRSSRRIETEEPDRGGLRGLVVRSDSYHCGPCQAATISFRPLNVNLSRAFQKVPASSV
jgi:hypothetical protein